MEKNDFGTKESRQHGAFIVEGVGKAQRARNLKTSWLRYYMERGILTRRQVTAGEKLLELYNKIGRRKCTAMGAIMPIQGGSSQSMTTTQAESDVRFREALKALGTRNIESVIYNVCIEDRSLKDLVGNYPYYHTASHLMPLLKEGLDAVADFFGVKK